MFSKLYVVQGEKGEVRYITTDYPEKYVVKVVEARGHEVLMKIPVVDLDRIKIYGDRKYETLPEYVQSFADEPAMQKAMPPELQEDVHTHLTCLPQKLDDLDLSVYVALDPVMRQLVAVG